MDALTIKWIGNTNVQPPGFKPVTTELLNNIIHCIVSGVQPQKVILFGSYAYGTPSPHSDLDLLVIMNTDERPVERILTISSLLRPRPFPMDILVRTPAEIATALEQQDTFIQEIMSKGIVLYEQGQ